MSYKDVTVKISQAWLDENNGSASASTSTSANGNPINLNADRIAKKVLKTASNMILSAPDGEKHFKLRDASYLLGGYVGGGLIDENKAYDTLCNAIGKRSTVKSMNDAIITIVKCLQRGIGMPITKEMKEAEYKVYIERFNSQTNSVVDTQKQENTVLPISFLKRILKTKHKLEIAKTKKIVFPTPIISRNGEGIIYPNTINTIQAKDGMFKSLLAGIVGSCILKRAGCTNTHLGFQADSSKSYTLLYGDTERNLEHQLPYALQQIQLQAGYTIYDKPSNFDFFSLLEYQREDRLSCLSEYLDYVRNNYDNHILIILDVITDCISDFNGVKESLKLIDLMNMLINSYNVTFLCIIHENPFSDKARGSVGTEIINKATTSFQLEAVKDSSGEPTGVVKVKYRKCRMSAKQDPFYIKYDQAQSLVLAEPDFTDSAKGICSIDSFIDFLEKELKAPLNKEVLFEKAIAKYNCGGTTISNRIKELIEKKILLFNNDGTPSLLNRRKQGKESIYELISYNSTDDEH